MDTLSALSNLLKKAEQQKSINDVRSKQKKEILKENLKRSVHDRGYIDDSLEAIKDYYSVKVINWEHLANVAVRSHNQCTGCRSNWENIDSLVSIKKDKQANTYSVTVIEDLSLTIIASLRSYYVHTKENPKTVSVCQNCVNSNTSAYVDQNEVIQNLLNKFGI